MDASFWHQRWRTNEIPFHEYAVNQQLFKHFSALSLAKAGRVFVPLCGKSLDIGWLLSRGYAVAGAELSEIAVQQLFVELGTTAGRRSTSLRVTSFRSRANCWVLSTPSMTGRH